MNAPLKRRAPGREIAGAAKLRLIGVYRPSTLVQALSWQREAQRLLTEYILTGQARHLQALARHLGGIYEQLTGSKL